MLMNFYFVISFKANNKIIPLRMKKIIIVK